MEEWDARVKLQAGVPVDDSQALQLGAEDARVSGVLRDCGH